MTTSNSSFCHHCTGAAQSTCCIFGFLQFLRWAVDRIRSRRSSFKPKQTKLCSSFAGDNSCPPLPPVRTSSFRDYNSIFSPSTRANSHVHFFISHQLSWFLSRFGNHEFIRWYASKEQKFWLSCDGAACQAAVGRVSKISYFQSTGRKSEFSSSQFKPEVVPTKI